jgi:hypothetical protein
VRGTDLFPLRRLADTNADADADAYIEDLPAGGSRGVGGMAMLLTALGWQAHQMITIVTDTR